MLTMPVKKLIVNLSLPLTISMLVQSLYNLVDSIFVSWISETALSATSLAAPLQHVMMAVAVGTGLGVNSLLSRTLGADNKKDADLIATTGLVLAVLSALLFIVFGLFLAEPFIRLFASDADLVEMGTTYLSICTMFGMGIFIATTAERLLQATGNAFLSMIAQASGAVINCILDPIMIFGLFGCPAMGIAGAAIATVIGQWGAAVVALVMNFRLNHEVEFDFRHFRMNGEILVGIYTVAVPSMLVSSLTSVQTMFVNKVLINISTTAVAFMGLFNKMQNFVLMPMNGMSMSVVPIVGHAYGAKRGARIREALRTILTVTASLMTVCTLIFLLFPRWILYLFKAEEGLLAIGIPGLRILSFTLVLMVVCMIIGQAYTAVGNGLVNLANTLVRNLLLLPIVYVLGKVSTINSIWFAILGADVLTFIFSCVMYRRLDKRVIAPMIAAYPEPVGAAEDKVSEA